MGPSKVCLEKVLVEISSSGKKSHSTQVQASENDPRLRRSAILDIAWSRSLKFSSSPTQKFMLGSQCQKGRWDSTSNQVGIRQYHHPWPRQKHGSSRNVLGRHQQQVSVSWGPQWSHPSSFVASPQHRRGKCQESQCSEEFHLRSPLETISECAMHVESTGIPQQVQAG